MCERFDFTNASSLMGQSALSQYLTTCFVVKWIAKVDVDEIQLSKIILIKETNIQFFIENSNGYTKATDNL